jgi:hypothetical protein
MSIEGIIVVRSSEYNHISAPQPARICSRCKGNGIVSWGDEGFSKSYKGEVKRRIRAKLNPGFLKPMPGVPEGLHERKIHEVYGGLGYLVVARKN